ncbi:MAG: ABC transporter ATP-binding protein [Lachnospiraceae bacterium]|nr:ABC transporter ATP-binding protein [Lachnospiraceae bacterium]
MIKTEDLTFYYHEYRKILEHVSITFEKGNLYAILGASGCGKSTLLSLLGGLLTPKVGKVLYEGTDIAEYGLERHRQDHVGFIFQGYNLIEYMTVAENVALTAKQSPETALQKVGLEKDLWKQNVLKLSGGQQQRVAIARALASDKPVLLADEPTGNLDEDSAQAVLDILKKSAHEEGRCVIMVTHSSALAAEADEIYRYTDSGFQTEDYDLAIFSDTENVPETIHINRNKKDGDIHA